MMTESFNRRIYLKLTKNLLAVAALLGSSTLTAAPFPLSDSGLVTVFPGQTAQLSVVNLGDPVTSCQLTLSFIDAEGITLPSTVTHTLYGGKSIPLVVPVAGASVSLRAHIDYSPQIIAQSSLKNPLTGCHSLMPTFEILDASGTRLLVNNFVGLPNNLPGDNLNRVAICHKPNKHSKQTLFLPTAALRGHLGHGDTQGYCP